MHVQDLNMAYQYSTGNLPFSGASGSARARSILWGAQAHERRTLARVGGSACEVQGQCPPEADCWAGTRQTLDIHVKPSAGKGYRQGDFSLRMTSDAWMGSDWYRTAAFEVGVGLYSMGINMFTTKPPQGEFDRLQGGNETYRSMWDSFLRKQPTVHDRGTYSSGSRVWAGLYFGYSDGFTVNRTGISAPWVQDFFQNGVHHFITTKSPYFNTGLGSPTTPFWQVLGSNPWTLY